MNIQRIWLLIDEYSKNCSLVDEHSDLRLIWLGAVWSAALGFPVCSLVCGIQPLAPEPVYNNKKEECVINIDCSSLPHCFLKIVFKLKTEFPPTIKNKIKKSSKLIILKKAPEISLESSVQHWLNI